MAKYSFNSRVLVSSVTRKLPVIDILALATIEYDTLAAPLPTQSGYSSSGICVVL